MLTWVGARFNMLEVSHLTAGYSRTDVLFDVNLRVDAGDFVGILGSNGAGKTTLLRSISGLTRVHEGEIRFDSKSVRGLAAEAIVDSGLIHVPQGRMLFPELTVEENLQLGSYRSGARGGYGANLARVEHYFPILKERKTQRAGVLSGGEQQMLAIGRALMAEPRLLILDEPSLGLAPRIIDDIFQVLTHINEESVTILVAEQNAMKVLEHARFVYVLENGRIAYSGSSEELSRSEAIQKSYLGLA
jgi:branched-chain amino acid transport system ATP-binding protein